jgi:phosphatidylserine decarboxylase
MSKPRRARALYEGRWILLVILLGAAFSCYYRMDFLVLLFSGLLLFCLWFFRDPERQTPTGASLAVSPADGTVTLVDDVEEEQFFKCRMKRISIFLSVFDVHVNRAPIAGDVLFIEGKGGLYLDARRPEASILNESLYWVFGSKNAPDRAVGVKQITGAIARRIVPWAQVGETMGCGERFGMIRFGSRTDLYLPLDSEVLISVGQKVKGAETVVARLTS